MARSYLFIPGNTPSMLQNLDVFESDAVIIDFEDSVLHYDKDAARHLVQSFLEKFSFENLDVFVRLNDPSTPFFKDDVKALESLDINGYVLPKATPQTMNQLLQLTKKEIIPIIESPLALLHAETIGQMDQVKGLLLGAEDYTKELNVKRSLQGQEIFTARSMIAIIANAYGIESIDTPYTDKDNEEGIYIDSQNARNLGFTSKSSIHPNHITAIHQVFSPSQEEINQALRILKKAETSTKGAFSLDGKMIDVPIIEKAKKVINQAKKYKLL